MTLPAGGPVVSIPFEVWRISRRMRLLLDLHVARYAVTPGEVGLYSVLRVGPMTPTDVARHSGIVPTTVSKMLQRIDERGHLERSANPNDGRSSLVGLNDAGRQFHAEAMKGIEAVIELIEHALGEDTEWVAFALLRLQSALSEVTGGATSDEDRERWPRKTHWDQRLTYEGDHLMPAEEKLVRDYIDWLRWRRSPEIPA